jgi:SHS2 domain-containing protein
MTYRWVDHTSEVELEIEAAGERGVLEEAVRALAELLGVDATDPPATDPPATDPPATDTGTTRRVTAAAPDRPALLAAWIEELAFLAESEGFVATRVIDIDLAAAGLHATVAGVLGEPPPLIKAVTYHRLEFARRGEGYGARVILDV